MAERRVASSLGSRGGRRNRNTGPERFVRDAACDRGRHSACADGAGRIVIRH